MKPSTEVILYFDPQASAFVALNMRSKRRFVLSREYSKRLIEQAYNAPECHDDAVISELLAGGLLSDKQQKVVWGGAPESYFSHLIARDYREEHVFLSESECRRAFVEYGSSRTIPDRHFHVYNESVKLPLPNYEELEQTSLLKVLAERFTCRDFLGENIDKELMATVLHALFSFKTAGHVETLDNTNLEPVDAEFRTSPSASGLQMFDGYIGILRVEGVRPGIYQYVRDLHELRLINPIFSDELFAQMCRGQYWCKNTSFVTFLVGDLRRMWAKMYDGKGYAISYLEAGHLSQTAQLLATSVGLNTWICGSFYDSLLEEYLHLEDASYLFCPMLVACGIGRKSRIPTGYS